MATVLAVIPYTSNQPTGQGLALTGVGNVSLSAGVTSLVATVHLNSASGPVLATATVTANGGTAYNQEFAIMDVSSQTITTVYYFTLTCLGGSGTITDVLIQLTPCTASY
jgi:hypothetical protein